MDGGGGTGTVGNLGALARWGLALWWIPERGLAEVGSDAPYREACAQGKRRAGGKQLQEGRGAGREDLSTFAACRAPSPAAASIPISVPRTWPPRGGGQSDHCQGMRKALPAEPGGAPVCPRPGCWAGGGCGASVRLSQTLTQTYGLSELLPAGAGDARGQRFGLGRYPVPGLLDPSWGPL